MIETVIRFKNDMVVVFDVEGEQMPEYQGQYDDVKESILRDVPPGSKFAHWFGRGDGPENIDRDSW